ncbi:unnamed protein product [Dovyalis caffra]|uniref:Uncharacterized protein n=1 Tax=Dovyalis caffra TaxID=77055 RepID=A0AAV1QRC8_9ROSI|nr:unnamed protein product [Dovyalis caffra]
MEPRDNGYKEDSRGQVGMTCMADSSKGKSKTSVKDISNCDGHLVWTLFKLQKGKMPSKILHLAIPYIFPPSTQTSSKKNN